MSHQHLTTTALINIFITSVTLTFFISLGNAKPTTNNDLNIIPLPPIPEDKTTSLQIESFLQKNVDPIECTSSDEEASSKIGLLSGVINPRYRWTNFNVYIDPAYNSQDRTQINNAMFRLSQLIPCVKFAIFPEEASKPSRGDYVNIIKSSNSGCWSYIGKRGGAQDMSLQSPGCMSIGTIMHEMIHALGFFHEQSRSDRDDFVTVLWQNIRPGMEHNFKKQRPSVTTSFGIPYNQRSIMHYSSTAFSSNGQPTIVSKTSGRVGSTGELQQTDIDKLKRMYNC